MQEVILKDFIKVSTNKIYESKSWFYRKKIKDDYAKWFLEYKSKFNKIDDPVHIEFDFYFKSHSLDCSNVSFMAKMIEDCLVSNKILVDDNNCWVKSVKYSSQKSNDKTTYCILKLIPD